MAQKSVITIRVPRGTPYVDSIPKVIADTTNNTNVKIDIGYIIRDERLPARSLKNIERYFNEVYNGNPDNVRLTDTEVLVVDRVLDNLHL